jgi:glutamine synthetase
MKELDEELWKIGVLAKTKHNEVAPAQHELAPIFSTTNIATDHNQLTMELMKSIANKHGLSCLIHEKPFAGVNGNGKHNNWSISTDTGVNLLEPGDTPYQNSRFLLFLCCIIKAVDTYQDLLRVSVASAGNDHRLGANEAPPAIVSIFLGEELTEILEAIETDSLYADKKKNLMEIGVNALPHFPKDTTDRNRTSPFAFTGNKFEFRMVGSAFSISGPNIVLNTIVAETLCDAADKLEKSTATAFKKDLAALIKKTIKEHKRIIFNGNNYSEDWVKEAKKRGLSNLKTTPDALPAYVEPKSIRLFTKHKVFTETEIRSRYEILLEGYCKTIHIEALTMCDLVKKAIIPAALDYQSELISLFEAKKGCGGAGGNGAGALDTSVEEGLLKKIGGLSAVIYKKSQELESALLETKAHGDTLEAAKFYREKIFCAMTELRLAVDELESLTDAEYWRFPTYAEILYSVN